MKTRQIPVLFAILFALAGLLAVNCGGGGGGSTDFKAYIQHFGGESTDWVAGLTVIALDNATGQPIGKEETSDAEGYVRFSWDDPAAMPAKVGFLVKGYRNASDDGWDDWVDTYSFDIDSSAAEERLWAVDQVIYEGAPLMAAITKQDGSTGLDPGTAILAGGIYWEEDVNGEIVERHIGCATAKTVPEDGQVRYMGNNGLPTNPTIRTTSNPLVSYFFIANLAAVATGTSLTAEAYMGTDKLGSTDLFVYPDSISISNIYADDTFNANPTPADCQ